MPARSFVDSNVLVYTDDGGAAGKQATALALMEDLYASRSGFLSIQVLQEYFVTTTRKLGVDAVLARRKVELFGRLNVVTIGTDDVLAAIDLHRLHGLSFWDALIVRSASHAGCRQLFTEDLQHGRRFDGIEIVNPFV